MKPTDGAWCAAISTRASKSSGTGVGQADAAAEEEQQIFLGRTEAARLSLIARDVAEIEDA